MDTSYDPDVEYVDGLLVKRNAGDWLHSLILRNLLLADPRLERMFEYRSGDLIQAPGRLSDGAGIELTRDEIFQR